MSEFEIAALVYLSLITACQLYIAVRMSDVYAGVWSVAHRLSEWERYLGDVARGMRRDDERKE